MTRRGTGVEYIDIRRIPKSDGNMLGSLLFTVISDYFTDPQHQREFEEWMRSKKKKEQPKSAAPMLKMNTK